MTLRSPTAVPEPPLPAGGQAVADRVWRPWAPAEAARRLATIRAPWYVAGGWALDLFLGRETPETASREHEDLEIAVPAGAWPEVARALGSGPDRLEFWAAGAEGVWPLADPAVDAPAALAAVHQTWVFDPGAAAFVLDVFREPHDGDRWICRREQSWSRPYAEIIARTAGGLPYLRPEWVLLFKARAGRPKDVGDLERVLPVLDEPTRRRTRDLIAVVHPGHGWLDRL